MKPAVAEERDLPCAPNSLALAKTSVKNIVGPDVTLGPIAFATGSIVTPLDEKAANVIIAVSFEAAIAECKV